MPMSNFVLKKEVRSTPQSTHIKVFFHTKDWVTAFHQLLDVEAAVEWLATCNYED